MDGISTLCDVFDQNVSCSGQFDDNVAKEIVSALSQNPQYVNKISYELRAKATERYHDLVAQYIQRMTGNRMPMSDAEIEGLIKELLEESDRLKIVPLGELRVREPYGYTCGRLEATGLMSDAANPNNPEYVRKFFELHTTQKTLTDGYIAYTITYDGNSEIPKHRDWTTRNAISNLNNLLSEESGYELSTLSVSLPDELRDTKLGTEASISISREKDKIKVLSTLLDDLENIVPAIAVLRVVDS